MPKKILVIDTDRAFLLQLRNDLGQFRDQFSALLTENSQVALDAITSHGIALVVTGAGVQLDGAPLAVQMYRRGLMTPVLLLAGEDEAAAADGWECCAVRTLQKPVDPLALAEAVRAVLDREALEGLLHGVTSSSFFQFVEVEKKTCTITVIKGADKGVLFFAQGRLMDARFQELSGMEAALHVLAWDKVDLAILNFCPLKTNRINRSIGNLLLEAAVAQDHAAAEAQGIDLSDVKPAAAPKAKSAPAPAAPAAAAKPAVPLKDRLAKALNGQRGVEGVAVDTSWADLIGLARTLGRDLGCGEPVVCTLSGVAGGGDIVLVPDAEPVAIRIGKFANRDVVVEQVLPVIEG